MSIEHAKTLTSRGFVIYLDDPGSRSGFPEQRIRVQESSRAGEGPFVWVFEGEPGADDNGAVQLSVRQALLTARALLSWVGDAVHDELTEQLRPGNRHRPGAAPESDEQ